MRINIENQLSNTEMPGDTRSLSSNEDSNSMKKNEHGFVENSNQKAEGFFVPLHDSSSMSTGEDPEKRDPTDSEQNILADYSEEQVMNMGRQFAKKYDLPNDSDIFARAAALARRPNEYDRLNMLTEEERIACYDEIHHPWSCLLYTSRCV